MSKAKTLNEQELNKLYKYFKSTKQPERNRLMCQFPYWSGMRVGEIASLKVKDVLNEDKSVKEEIHLEANQTKGNNSRIVFIPSKLIHEIEIYVKQANLTWIKCSDFPLFPPTTPKGDDKETHFTADSLTHRFKYFYRKAGISNGSSHSGRRTFITNLANVGVSARVLQSLAGHSSLRTTQEYIDINDEMKKKAIELI